MTMQITFGVTADDIAEGFDHEPANLIEAMIALRERLVPGPEREDWIVQLQHNLAHIDPEQRYQFRRMLRVIVDAVDQVDQPSPGRAVGA